MSAVQIVTRNTPFSIDIIALGEQLDFLPNAQGHVVCDEVGEAATAWLLTNDPIAFRLYAQAPQKQAVSPVLASVVSVLTPTADTASAAQEAQKDAAPTGEQAPQGDAAPTGEKAPDEAHPHVLKDEAGATVLDLRPLNDAELFAFAAANNITVHPNCKGDTIRNKIVEFLRDEG